MTPVYIEAAPVRCECPYCGHLWTEDLESDGLETYWTTVWCPACERPCVVSHALIVVSCSHAIAGVGSAGTESPMAESALA